MVEKFFTPPINKDQIGPEKKLTEPVKQKSKERRERQDSLSQHILKWWQGDAHTHSKESTREGFGYPEGIYDIEEMLSYYKSLGLAFVCFTEHASKPGAPEKQAVDSGISQSLLSEAARIKKLNQQSGGDIAALSGVEANILFDEDGEPSLDLPDEVLRKLDLVIASRHAIAQEKEPAAIKKTLLFAIRNPQVDVIGHPDRYTRKDKETSPEYWQEYWEIWPEILAEMVKNNKAFEINLNNPPTEELIEMAALAGVRFFINYDAHDFNQYKKEQTEISAAGEKAKKKWAKEEFADSDLEVLKSYKMERLSSGPGVMAILKLVRLIKKLESLGVMPDRVVNSSRDNLLDFLTKDRDKKTGNLDFLKSL